MFSSVMDEVDFMYCPRCGGRFTKTSPKFLVCRSCSLEYYVNPRPCNAILIPNERNEILLVKRARDPSKDKWDLPGGFMDIDESAEMSVSREAKEELGITLCNIRYMFSVSDRYTYSGIQYHTLGFVFSSQIESGTLIPQDDVSEVKYFEEKQIPWTDLAFPGIEIILRKYCDSLHQ